MTSNVEAMRRLFKVANQPNLPLFPEIYPKREGPIIRADVNGRRQLTTAAWGIAGPATARGPVTNIRNLASPFWRTALTRPDRRCLVPATAFAEWTAEPDPATGRKRKMWFEMCDREPFVFAGVVFPTGPDELDRYAFRPIQSSGPSTPRRCRSSCTAWRSTRG